MLLLKNEIYRLSTALHSLIMAIIFLNLRGVGMTKEEVFEAAKALEPEEEGCSFNFIVLDISVECSASSTS